MLKEIYLYYFVNEVVYVNIDLEVIDKFSGKVVMCVVLVDVKVIDVVIVVVVDVMKLMCEMLVYWW